MSLTFNTSSGGVRGNRCVDTSQEVHIRQRQKPGRSPAEERTLTGSTASPGSEECIAASDGDVYELAVAKRDFLQALKELALVPRGLDYKVVFPGPGGANAIRAALKLPRRVTGRQTVVSFTDSFHGMTLAAPAISGNATKRAAAGVPLTYANPLPYEGYLDDVEPGPRYLDRLLSDAGSGLDRPAAVVVETVQGEGGLNAASTQWLRDLAEVRHRHDVLLIVDDVQMGCGRTGPFFRGRVSRSGCGCAPGLAHQVCVAAFERGLLVETSGARGDVVKLLPPLTIGDDEPNEGLDTVRTCVSAVLARAG